MNKTNSDWGGLREGAGRKSLLNKKQPTQVYLEPRLKKQIEMTEIDQCFNLSQKWAYLIKKGLQSMSDNVITKTNNTLEINNNYKVEKKTEKYIDVFAGLGGIRIGFESVIKRRWLEDN